MRLAQQRNRDVADLLAETIERSLSQAEVIEPVESASDSEVMALTQLQMPPDQDDRLSLLLYKQQAETLGIEERSELSALMEIYKEGLLRKAQALKEEFIKKLGHLLEHKLAIAVVIAAVKKSMLWEG